MLSLTLGSGYLWWTGRGETAVRHRPRTAVTTLALLNAALLLLGGALLAASPLGNLIGAGNPQGDTGFELLALTRVIGLAAGSAGLLALNFLFAPHPAIWLALLAGNLLAFLMASIQQLAIWNNLPGFLVAAAHLLLALLLAGGWLWDSGGRGRILPRLATLWQATGFALALYLSGVFLLVAAAAVFVHEQLREINDFGRWLLVLETAVLLGLLLTTFLQDGINKIRQTIARLAALQEVIPPEPRWPFTSLMQQLRELAAQQQQSTKLRGRLRQQIRDATAQEERNRLARDLHDSIKQQLFAINVSAAAVQTRWEADPAGARAALADVRGSAQAAMVEMNALLQQLRPSPLENVGLLQALAEQCAAVELRTNAAVQTEFCPLPPAERWPAGGQTAVFRIAQEVLANIARHARAEHVWLQLSLAGGEKEAVLVLGIRDDGAGFDPGAEAQGMGLDNMRARAQGVGAVLEVDSAPGSGTAVTLQLPLLPAGGAVEPADSVMLTDLNRMLRNGAVAAFVMAITYALVQAGSAVEQNFFFTMMLSLHVGLVVVTAMVNYGLRRMPVSAAALRLRGRSYGLRLAALLAIFMLALAMPLAMPWWGGAAFVSLPTLALVALLLGGTGVRLYQTIDQWYRRLPMQRKGAVRRQLGGWRQFGWMIAVILLINCIVSFFFIAPALPPRSGPQWLQSLLISVTLAAGGVLFAVERLQRAWSHSAADSRAEKEREDA